MADEYTPTDEQIRDAATSYRGPCWTYDEYDRWLTEFERRVRADQRYPRCREGRELMAGIEVTVRDLETNETETKVIENDYLLITAGDWYLASTNAYTKTHVLTVKRAGKDE